MQFAKLEMRFCRWNPANSRASRASGSQHRPAVRAKLLFDLTFCCWGISSIGALTALTFLLFLLGLVHATAMCVPSEIIAPTALQYLFPSAPNSATHTQCAAVAIPPASCALAQTGQGSKDVTTKLSRFKDIAGIVESLAKVIALAVGGWWTYLLFVRKRQQYPRAKVTHTVIHKPLASGQRLLHVATNVTNTGEVLLCLVSGFTRIQQMSPPPSELVKCLRQGHDPVKQGETEYEWPSVGERKWDWQDHPHEVEPGEDDEIDCDFVVESDAETLEIYTYLKNKAKPEREIGWNLTTIYDLQERPKESPPPNGV